MATPYSYAVNDDDVIVALIFGYDNRFTLRVVLEYGLHDWVRRSDNPCDVDGLRLSTAREHKTSTKPAMRTPCKPCQILISPLARRIVPLKVRHTSRVIQQSNRHYRTNT